VGQDALSSAPERERRQTTHLAQARESAHSAAQARAMARARSVEEELAEHSWATRIKGRGFLEGKRVDVNTRPYG
jgi:hypothetical protein